MKRVLKMFAVMLWIFTAIVTGACALNTAVPFYMIFGALNILLSGLACFSVIAVDLGIFKKKED